jgi:Aspartyl protease
MTLKLTRWLPIACALLPLATLGAPPAAIKLTSQLGTELEMSLEINGIKGWLTVDSGAMSTTLDKRLAKDHKVSLERGQGTIVGIGGSSNVELGEITVRVPRRQPKDFPNLSGKHHFVAMGQEIKATSLGRDLGMIGLSELMRAGAIIDCAGSRLILHPEGDFHPPHNSVELTMLRYAASSKVVNSEVAAGFFLWALPVKIANKAGVMIVDTGCEPTVVHQDFAKLVGIEPVGDDVSARGVGGAGSQMMTFCAIPDLLLNGKLQLSRIHGMYDASTISGYSLKDVAGGDLPVIGILGLDQLIRIKAFVDCKRGVIHTTDEPLKPERPNHWSVDCPKAIDALANAGDKEAIKFIKKRDEGDANINAKQAKKFVERAVQKGLLKEDEKPTP